MKYNERIRAIKGDHFLTQQKFADLRHIRHRAFAMYDPIYWLPPLIPLVRLTHYRTRGGEWRGGTFFLPQTGLSRGWIPGRNIRGICRLLYYS